MFPVPVLPLIHALLTHHPRKVLPVFLTHRSRLAWFCWVWYWEHGLVEPCRFSWGSGNVMGHFLCIASVCFLLIDCLCHTWWTCTHSLFLLLFSLYLSAQQHLEKGHDHYDASPSVTNTVHTDSRRWPHYFHGKRFSLCFWERKGNWILNNVVMKSHQPSSCLVWL